MISNVKRGLLRGKDVPRKRKGSRRKVTYSKYGVPKKYDGGSARLAAVIKRIAELYKAGRRVPQSLINERMRLGKKSLKRKSRKRR
tara:strand:- start:2299 stop:2556 length:258 start_codon:yes stop_codon:yes gene_type:complete